MIPQKRFKHRGQTGFSLLELVIAIALFSILAGTLQLSTTRRLIDDLERDQAEQVADNIYRLANAAQHYSIRNNEWPNETLQCESAYTELDEAGLLKGALQQSPYLDEDDEYSDYDLSCDENHFTITVTAETDTQAATVAQKIPGATVTDSTISAHYPKPADEPDGAFMPLDGSEQPTATWDMGNQYLFGVRDVVSETGQTLVNSVQFATTIGPDGLVRKPTCPSDMSPRIFTTLNKIVSPSARPLHSIELPVEELEDFWRVRAIITASDGTRTDPDDSAADIVAFVKCSY